MAHRDMEGVRVVEYGQWMNAAYAGKMMADLGATVIKIEEPSGDEPSRIYGPFPSDIPDLETSGVHLYQNCNKLGVTLSLDSETGKQLFRELARWADVVIDGTQPGYLDSLGLDFESLRQHNIGLIMIAVTSMGQSGEYARYKGYDATSWHGSGSSSFYLGEPDREPLVGAWYQASQWGAFNVASAGIMALHARDRTGRGQYVDISEIQALATLFISIDVSDYFENDVHRVRTGVEMTTQAPAGMRKTKDGWVYIMALAPHQWEGLVEAMGNPGWAQSEIFKGTSRERSPYSAEIYELMTPWLESHTAEEIFEKCQSRSVPASPIHSVKDLYEHEHLEDREYFVEIEHPVAGLMRIPGAPVQSDSATWAIDRPAPQLGQHNHIVYSGFLGILRVELMDLYRSGVI